MAAYSPYEPEETSLTSNGGGCFSLLIIPLVTILLIVSWLRFLYGGAEPSESTAITLNELPVSAHTISSQDSQSNSASNSGIAPLFSASVRYWEEDIIRWAQIANLDPNLVATVMQIESCGDPQALSTAGAIGLFQVMPFHFGEGEMPYNPEINAARGMDYLQKSLATHGTVRLALAGYNGGIRTAGKSESEWPQETIRYAYWGSGIYKEASEFQTVSQRLEEWYAAGGASLCRQAEQRLGISP